MKYRVVDMQDWFILAQQWESEIEALHWLNAWEHKTGNHRVMSDQAIHELLFERYRKACADCFNVQDASNFSGVVLSLPQVMRHISNWLKHETGDGHYGLRTHPALVLYVDKINDMMGRPAERQDSSYYSAAMDACKAIVAAPVPEMAAT